MLMRELDSFYEYMEKFKARRLTKCNLVESFLDFMNETYGYNQDYFRNEYEEKYKMDFENFNDYLYDYIGLKGDIRQAYENIITKDKERIKKYKSIVYDLNKKIEKEIDNNKKNKLKFFLKINTDLYSRAEELRQNERIVRRAINKCSKYNVLLQPIFFDEEFSAGFLTYEQYEKFDWKTRINFSHLSISSIDQLTNLKVNNHDEYLKKFKQFVEENKICEHIIAICEENYYLQDRKEIIWEAVKMFKESKFTSFVYFLVPQVEGLFDVYKKINNIDNDGNANGMPDKIKPLYEQKGLWGYVYYAFDFPILRNNIAHGTMISIQEEDALDVLMDICNLMEMISSNDNTYKVIIEFINELGRTDEKEDYVLNYFSEKINLNDSINWLDEYLNGSYNEVLHFYGHANSVHNLLDILKSKSFIDKVFNSEEPLSYTRENDEIEVGGSFYSIIEYNDSFLKYIPLIELLKNKIDFPELWLTSMYNRVDELEKEQKRIWDKLGIDFSDEDME